MYDTDSIGPLVDRFPRLFHGKPPEVPSSIPSGWVPLVTRLLEDIDAMLDDAQAKRFRVLQIKEKFAGLSGYWTLGPQTTTVVDLIGLGEVQRLRIKPHKPTELFERVSVRVRAAETASRQLCQRCGADGGSAGGRGWIVTLCASCRALPEDAS